MQSSNISRSRGHRERHRARTPETRSPIDGTAPGPESRVFDTAEMVSAAKKLKRKYIAITDHSKSSHIANGLDEKRLIEHCKEIMKINRSTSIRVFKGSEVDILADGSLDYSNDILKQLDIVVASRPRHARRAFVPALACDAPPQAWLPSM